MPQKKRQPGNPPVRNPPPKQGAMMKFLRAAKKRVNRKPQIPRGR